MLLGVLQGLRAEGSRLRAFVAPGAGPPDPQIQTRRPSLLAEIGAPALAKLPGAKPQGPYWLSLSTAIKASWGTSTLPMAFMRFLPLACFCSSFFLREMSPP